MARPRPKHRDDGIVHVSLTDAHSCGSEKHIWRKLKGAPDIALWKLAGPGAVHQCSVCKFVRIKEDK